MRSPKTNITRSFMTTSETSVTRPTQEISLNNRNASEALKEDQNGTEQTYTGMSDRSGGFRETASQKTFPGSEIKRIKDNYMYMYEDEYAFGAAYYGTDVD
ncbi:uncharacterized protein LOC111109910 isoform X2 [Crassostrea virginica]